jgi:hypothetical protein
MPTLIFLTKKRVEYATLVLEKAIEHTPVRSGPNEMSICLCSRLSWPDLVCKLTDKLQFRNHIVLLDRISTAVACETTLRAHANSDQSFFLAFSGPFAHPFHRFHHSRLHLINILHLWEFTCDNP